MFRKPAHEIAFDKFIYPLCLDAYTEIKTLVTQPGSIPSTEIKAKISTIFDRVRNAAYYAFDPKINSHQALKRFISEMYRSEKEDYADFCYAYSKLYASSEYLDEIKNAYETDHHNSVLITYLS